jgi:2-iminobutanoate/2-iminopropanoate deaminase
LINSFLEDFKLENISFEDLARAVLQNNPSANVNFIKKAFDFAEATHRCQKRDEGSPYFEHPCRVALYLAKDMGMGDEKVIATALLHDTLEDDGNVTEEVLKERFGEDVAGNVAWLSKARKTGRISREERDREYYDRLRQAPEDVWRVKVADRLDNVRSLHLSPNREKKKRYISATRENVIPKARKIFPPAADEMGKILQMEEIKIMEKQVISTKEAPAAIGPYSQGIKTGNLLFISGQLPLDPQTGAMVEGEIGVLTRQCIENLSAVVKAAGGKIENLVMVTIYITDMTKFADINKAYSEYFKENPPARAVVAVRALPKNAEIEICAVAAL